MAADVLGAVCELGSDEVIAMKLLSLGGTSVQLALIGYNWASSVGSDTTLQGYSITGSAVTSVLHLFAAMAHWCFAAL